MAESARDQLLKRLADAQREQETVQMALIQVELDDIFTGLAAAEDQAAARLRDAHEALTVPLARLAEMDAGISAAEGRCVRWSHQISGPDPDVRAKARMHFTEWSAEIDRLRAERDEAERGFLPLYEARDRGRKELRMMQGGKRVLAAAMLDPFGHLGQQTKAYEAYRQLHLNHVLLQNDRADPEWGKAIAELEELCMRSGWRSDGLPTDAEMAARALEMSGMANAANTPPAPAPNMVDIMAQTDAEMTNLALQKSPSKIEDHRIMPPPPREWMQLPGRGAR